MVESVKLHLEQTQVKFHYGSLLPPIHPTISHLEEVHVLIRTTYVSVVMSQDNLFPEKSSPVTVTNEGL